MLFLEKSPGIACIVAIVMSMLAVGLFLTVLVTVLVTTSRIKNRLREVLARIVSPEDQAALIAAVTDRRLPEWLHRRLADGDDYDTQALAALLQTSRKARVTYIKSALPIPVIPINGVSRTEP